MEAHEEAATLTYPALNASLADMDEPSAPPPPPDDQHGDEESGQKEVVGQMNAFSEKQLAAFYVNRELQELPQHLQRFQQLHLEATTMSSEEDNGLKALLARFKRSSCSAAANKAVVARLRAVVEEKRRQLWTLTEEEVEETGECSDMAEVTAKHAFNVAEFDEGAAAELRTKAREVRRALMDALSLDIFQKERWKMKIEDVVARTIADVEAGQQRPLEDALSVIFDFMRQTASGGQEDRAVAEEAKCWLDRLAAVALRDEADVRMRLFLLNHVLRCPAGVGKWATKYVQVAAPPVEDCDQHGLRHPLLDHLVAVLSVLMSPVDDRPDFLKALKGSLQLTTTDEEDAVWSVMDGEGEEEEDLRQTWHLLSESDLVAFFDQIPFGHSFQYILGVGTIDGELTYEAAGQNGNTFVPLLAFASRLMGELRRGFETFNRPRYRSLAKRICQVIREVVTLVTSHWLAFKAANTLDAAMTARIQVEYDEFFLRAVRSIFSAHELGTWQYFSDLPYDQVSVEALWRVFYVLHLDYHDDVCQKFGDGVESWKDILTKQDLVIQFEENLCKARPDERHFLLTAFSSMAAARDPQKEEDFISACVLDVFRVGFVLEGVADLNLVKEAKDQISAIALRHPYVLSLIVREFRKEEENDKLEDACRCLSDLPFNLWSPGQQDFDLLLAWLRCQPLPSVRNRAARTILSGMNWSCWPEGGETVLPWSYHRDLMTTLVAVNACVDAEQAAAGLLESGRRQVSKLTAGESAENAFRSWALALAGRLRTHACDRGDQRRVAAVNGDRWAFEGVLDHELDICAESLSQGLAASSPLALYAAVQATTLGHSMPLICQTGFAYAARLAATGQYPLAVRCLANLTPLFFHNASEALAEDVSFVAALQSLLDAEKSVLQKVVSYVFPGPVLLDLASAVQRQIQGFESYGLSSPSPVMSYWLKSLAKTSHWTSSREALYVADVICGEALHQANKECYVQLRDVLGQLHVERLQRGERGLMSWFGKGKFYSLLSAPNAECSYFAFAILDMEENREETQR